MLILKYNIIKWCNIINYDYVTIYINISINPYLINY